MKKYYTRSDLAIESLAHAVKDKDYKHSEKKEGNVTITAITESGNKRAEAKITVKKSQNSNPTDDTKKDDTPTLSWKRIVFLC